MRNSSLSRRAWFAVLCTAAALGGGLGFSTLRPGTTPIPREHLAAPQRPAQPAAPVPLPPNAVMASPAPPETAAGLATQTLKPRPAEEWQGMLVDLALQPPCGASADCGLARACMGGRCVDCKADTECSRGEVCVLDHCVLADQVACRVAKNCGGQDQCVLTGYASDPRGNSSMRAVCMGPSTVTLPKPALERRQPEGADQRGGGSDPYQELFEAARHGRITASF